MYKYVLIKAEECSNFGIIPPKHKYRKINSGNELDSYNFPYGPSKHPRTIVCFENSRGYLSIIEFKFSMVLSSLFFEIPIDKRYLKASSNSLANTFPSAWIIPATVTKYQSF